MLRAAGSSLLAALGPLVLLPPLCGLLLLQRVDKGEELLAEHERDQGAWNSDAVGLLVVLHETAKCPLCGAQRAVEHVAEGVLRLESALGLHGPRLIVQAIGAGHELSVLSAALVIARKPALQIVLLGRSVVELSRDDGHSPVRDSEGLVELLSHADHLLVLLPRLLRLRQSELLDLLELVHTENPANVTARAAGLTPEAG
mmetsp:Transcript_44103/g.137324  ORF Transcript_44103/g.137324 Transcript_44103/m.137324 type:complete len:201 (+) Transcript_44103:153-755(+)